MAARHLIAFAALGLAAMPAFAANDDISVDIDHARVLKMPRPAATVIIGNPAIADISVQDARTMVLTGRSYGTTNLIVLDENGDAMVDRTVGVRSSELGTVRVYRQLARQTVSCRPECEPTVSIGDTVREFTDTLQQVDARQKLAVPSDPAKE